MLRPSRTQSPLSLEAMMLLISCNDSLYRDCCYRVKEMKAAQQQLSSDLSYIYLRRLKNSCLCSMMAVAVFGPCSVKPLCNQDFGSWCIVARICEPCIDRSPPSKTREVFHTKRTMWRYNLHHDGTKQPASPPDHLEHRPRQEIANLFLVVHIQICSQTFVAQN